jgi:hypothetical protein
MVDKLMRQLCGGWEHRGELPSETTFSRAFAEFARSALPGRWRAKPAFCWWISWYLASACEK